MTIRIHGNWKEGFCLDYHTVDSCYLGLDEYGHEQWSNVRTEIGELVYRLKYRNDFSVISDFVNHITKRIKGIEKLDYIIPVPPSRTRTQQPVFLIAQALGKTVGVPVLRNAIAKRRTEREQKNYYNAEDSKPLRNDSFAMVGNIDICRKNLLLLDDLYGSGQTLKSITDILYKKAHANAVYVLTMTRRRSKQ